MRRALTAWVALVAAGTGCFYTDDINRPPTAEIEQTNAGEPLYLGGVIELSAAKSRDEDGDPLMFTWRARACDTVESCDTEPFANHTSRDTTWNLVLPSQGELAVRLRAGLIAVELDVEDTHGADADSSQFFNVLNQAPTVGVQVQGVASPSGGFTVGRPIDLIATPDDPDDDPASLDVTWELQPATGSVPADREWTQVSALSYRLRPDVDGLWRVQLTVTDPLDATDDHIETILIDPDHPPCLATVAPAYVPGAVYVAERAEGVRRFAALSVTDELDPYPLPPDDDDPDRGQATFRWWLASPATGGELAALDHALADYYLDPAGYAPGDRVSLRVEAADRVARALPCADTAPTCSIEDDGCLQRVTWEVEIR